MAKDLDRLVQADRVHRDIYTDAAIFDAEMQRIFERTWVYVGHESEIPDAHDFKTAYIGRQAIILVRGDDGTLNALLNRCMHRGAVVCREERGNTHAFTCIYHGWRYNSTGVLTGVPFRDRYGRDFDAAALSLMRIPRVESYRGFIFASLSRDGVSLADHLGRARHYIDLVVDTSPDGEISIRSGVHKLTYPGNWKFQVENWVDGYHPNFTHRSVYEIRRRQTGQGPRSDANSGATALTFGRGHAACDYSTVRPGRWASSARKEPEYLAALAQRLGENRAREVLEQDVHLLVFPNLFFQKDQQHIRMVRPVAVNETEVYVYPYAAKGMPDAISRRGVRELGWWASAGGFGQVDDVEAFVRCQEGLRSSQAEWVLFMRGVGQEQVNADGESWGDATDEITQRGVYREWKRLMSLPADAQP
jgi:phenylpropionate dioxygenase-like ring-hydroxylating dioxygenase large terminal subunit